MNLASIRRAVASAGTELSERQAVATGLASVGHRKLPHVVQERTGDRRIVRIYVWRDTPLGNIALVSGPDVDAELYELHPASERKGTVYIESSRFGPALSDEPSATRRSNPSRASEPVGRGGTALVRRGPSAPVRYLHEQGLLRSPILDFGSGYGADAEWLEEQGYRVKEYDPAFEGVDRMPGGRFATVLVTYVVNVLPAAKERKLLAQIRKATAPGGVAFVAVRTDVKRAGPTTRGYQRPVELDAPHVVGAPSSSRIYALEAPRRNGRRTARRFNEGQLALFPVAGSTPEPLDSGRLVILNMGLGRDSLAMLCLLTTSGLLVDGELLTSQDVDAVVFSDTGAEWQHTYDLIPQVTQICAEAGIRFIILERPPEEVWMPWVEEQMELRGAAREAGESYTSPTVPWSYRGTEHTDLVTVGASGKTLKTPRKVPATSSQERAESGAYHLRPPIMWDFGGKSTIAMRSDASCTDNHKIAPIRRLMSDLAREKYGVNTNRSWAALVRAGKRRPHLNLIGYAADELARAERGEEAGCFDTDYATEAYPLVEMGITKAEEARVLTRCDLQHALKSGCWLCPHQPLGWFWVLRETDPDTWRQVVEYETRAMDRKGKSHAITGSRPISEMVERWRANNPEATMADVLAKTYAKCQKKPTVEESTGVRANPYEACSLDDQQTARAWVALGLEEWAANARAGVLPRSNPVARTGSEKTDPKTGELYYEWRPVMPDGSRPRVRLGFDDEEVVQTGEAEDILAGARHAEATRRTTEAGRKRTGKPSKAGRAPTPRKKAKKAARAPAAPPTAEVAPMFDSAGREYIVNYRVVATAENGRGPVVPSNAPKSMARMESYPVAFQARSLAGAAESAKIREIGRNLDPTRLLIANADATLGAPVVWHDGNALFVLAGNGRTIALLGAPESRYRAYEKEGRKLWPTLWPKRAAPKGKRNILVRIVYNADGSTLTEPEAVNLAGASQASTAGAESPIGAALSTVRALGLTDLSGAPPFEWAGIVTPDNVGELNRKNRQFIKWLLSRLDPATAESYKTEEGLTDLINRVMVGFLPDVIQQRGFASEKEERALLAAMPILVTLHQGVELGRVKPGWDLLPLLGAAEQFASLVRRDSVKGALKKIEQAARQLQIGDSTEGMEAVQTLWDELPPLAIMLGFVMKKAAVVRDPAVPVEKYLAPYLESALRDVPGQAILLGGAPDPAETLARILKIPLPQRTRVRNPAAPVERVGDYVVITFPRTNRQEVEAPESQVALFAPRVLAELAVAHFASGSNHPGEIRGFASLHKPVGVAHSTVDKSRPFGRSGSGKNKESTRDWMARGGQPRWTDLCRADCLRALIAAANVGIPIFIDSGAFSEVDFDARGPYTVAPITPEDWEERIAFYEEAVDGARGNADMVNIVAPDKVGFQTETLERLRRYGPRMKALANRGAVVLVPLQKGDLSLSEFHDAVCEALGFGSWVPAIPMKKAATTPDELAEYLRRKRPSRVHLLGVGPDSDLAPEVVAAVLDESPTTEVQMDSVILRAKIGRGKKGSPDRPLTAAQDVAREEVSGHRFCGYPPEWLDSRGRPLPHYDSEIGTPSDWLTGAARKRIADALQLNRAQRRAWNRDPDKVVSDLLVAQPELSNLLNIEWGKVCHRLETAQVKQLAVERVFHAEGPETILRRNEAQAALFGADVVPPAVPPPPKERAPDRETPLFEEFGPTAAPAPGRKGYKPAPKARSSKAWGGRSPHALASWMIGQADTYMGEFEFAQAYECAVRRDEWEIFTDLKGKKTRYRVCNPEDLEYTLPELVGVPQYDGRGRPLVDEWGDYTQEAEALAVRATEYAMESDPERFGFHMEAELDPGKSRTGEADPYMAERVDGYRELPRWAVEAALGDELAAQTPGYSMDLRFVNVSKREAADFIRKHHSALPYLNPRGLMYALGLMKGDRLVAVATAGTPSGGWSDPHGILELTRVASDGSTKGAASKLVSRIVDLLPHSGREEAASSDAPKMLVTYQLGTESGTTYKALRDKGLRPVEFIKGKGRASGSRRKAGDAALASVDKIKWECCETPPAGVPDWDLLDPRQASLLENPTLWENPPTPSFLPDEATSELVALARDGARTYAQPFPPGIAYLDRWGLATPSSCVPAEQTLYERETCTFELTTKGKRASTKLSTQAAADFTRAQTRMFGAFTNPPKGTQVQTLLFARADFGTADAAEWARDHGFEVPKVHPTKQYIRIRQRAPREFRKGTFRTIELVAGVKAIVGRPK